MSMVSAGASAQGPAAVQHGSVVPRVTPDMLGSTTLAHRKPEVRTARQVLRSRGSRIATTALAIAAGAMLAAPASTIAAPAPAPQAAPISVPMVPEGVPVDALAAFAPAVAGLVAGPADVASPQTALLDQARALLATLNLPPAIKATLERIITFLDGSGGGGPELPQDGPAIAQFLYPTIGKGCIGDGADSVGTALAVARSGAAAPARPRRRAGRFRVHRARHQGADR